MVAHVTSKLRILIQQNDKIGTSHAFELWICLPGAEIKLTLQSALGLSTVHSTLYNANIKYTMLMQSVQSFNFCDGLFENLET